MITRKDLKIKSKELEKEEKQVYDQEGRVIINLTVLNDSEFLSPYGEDDDVLISSETASFIEHSTKPIHPRKDLTLVLNSNVIDENEQVYFEKGVRNYYENTFLELNKKLKSNFLACILLTIAGFVWFGVLIGLSFVVKYDIVIEMISIAGWVFLWEAVDLFFLQRPGLKRQQFRAYALMNAKIKFQKLKTKKQVK